MGLDYLNKSECDPDIHGNDVLGENEGTKKSAKAEQKRLDWVSVLPSKTEWSCKDESQR
jgi:hypothetical protein